MGGGDEGGEGVLHRGRGSEGWVAATRGTREFCIEVGKGGVVEVGGGEGRGGWRRGIWIGEGDGRGCCQPGRREGLLLPAPESRWGGRLLRRWDLAGRRVMLVC